ncbi:hypothetical protein RB595_000965 [Gaeumannomyces hyphopodioides]
MSVDMVTAEYQAPAELGDDPGFEDAAERDVSMVAHEGLDDITFDADDSYLGYPTSDQTVNAPPIPVEDELDYEPSYESPGPVDARLDHQDTVGVDLIPLEDEVGEDNNTAVDSAIPHGVVSEIDAHQIPDDHEAPSDLQIPRSPVATQLSAPGDDDLVGEIDYEDNEESGEAFVEVAQQSGTTHEPDEVDNGGAYLDGHRQSPEESADLEYAVLNSEPSNDHTHTMPPNEEPDSPVSRHGNGDEFDLDAKGHDDHTGLDGVGLDSDAEDALPPAQADLSVHDHHQEPSMSEEEREDNYGGEDDPEYMDVAEIDDQALDEFSTRPQVRIRYRDTTYSLFATSKSDDPYSFFFSDIEALEHPLSQFLAGLREVLSDEITPDEDVLIRIDGLGLEFADTMDKSSLDRITFGAIVDLHERLAKADNPNTRDVVLLVYLVTRPNAMRRLDSLLDAASIGEGLSAYHVSYPDYLLIDFPAREDSAETTSESTHHTSNGDVNADLESDQDPDEDAQPDELQGVDQESPPHTNATSDWHESGDVADRDEDLLGDSYDQVIDDARERTSVYSNHSASHKGSPTGPWDHETDNEAVGEQHPEALAYERAESDVEDTRSDQGSGRSDAYLNPAAALDEADEEAEPTYETEERQVASDDQELDEIDDLITEELETSDKGQVDGQVEGEVEGNASGPSYTADDDHDLGTWEDGEHDARVAVGEGILASPLRNTEPREPPEAEAEAQDVDNAQEAIVGEDQPFEMLRRQSAADMANAAASLEHSSASATLDGEEIDLEEVLATADPTDGDQLKDDFENSHEEPPEADEIDWEDNENDGATADGITSPSSNTGKRAREVDDGEVPGDRHDVKRHRT